MNFANPTFLFALAALAIPIIIHLFNFRKFRRVMFTNVRFLREVRHDTKARNKLKNILILACRLLAIFFLVMAFAQPFIPQDNATVKKGQKAVSIWVDNSFSMDAVGANGSLLDEVKKDAREIVAAYNTTDRFQLLTNDFEGRHQRLVSKEEFLNLLEEVKPSPAVRNISEVVRRQQDLLNNTPDVVQENKEAFLLSDFQQTVSDFARIKVDTTIQFREIIASAQNKNNLYIDSVWFETPVRKINQPEAMHVRIRSRSDVDMENVPMRLYVNGQAKTPASFSVAANSTTDTILYFTIREPGLQQGLIEINDYPVTFDDRFYFSFTVLKNIPVLSIEPSEAMTPAFAEPHYLKTLFATDSAFVFTETDEGKIDYTSFANYRFIVLNSLKSVSSGLANELKKFVDNGGSLMVFPGAGADVVSYNALLNPLGLSGYGAYDTTMQPVEHLNFQHPLYQGVFERTTGNMDMPMAGDHYKILSSSRSREEELMRLRNGDVFMASYRSGKGNVYLSAVGLYGEFGNLPRHALFVPTLYQAALFSQPQGELFYTISDSKPVDIGDVGTIGENPFHLTDEAQKFDVIPAHVVQDGKTLLDVQRMVVAPGNYLVNLDNRMITGISFNYDRTESDMRVFTKDEIEAQHLAAGLQKFSVLDKGLDGLTEILTEKDYGIRLWKICIWLVLACMLAEILLIRLWKNRTIPIATTT
ncbi:MAG TPA: BatA domain-containing protein [Bacteroidia bacterium]|nr:BatA domain-containing protein [Bacteroidia bacterium]